jgi:RhtB (resistance to homoserine/threonine) family protein
MNPDWLNIATFLLIFVFAIISPGPNFIMVSNTALAGSRRIALLAAFGVAVGSGIFAVAGMLGLIVLVKTLPYFDEMMPIIGGGYLAYLGVRMIRERHAALSAEPRLNAAARQVSSFSAFLTGLLTNLTNPKAWAFYVSLFTLVMTPQTPPWTKSLLVILMFLISLFWYGTVVLLISSERIRPLFSQFRPLIQTTLGLLLVYLGVRLFFNV